MTVQVPPGFADRLDRFGPRFIKVERAESGVKRSGKRPVDPEWQRNPMFSDDERLLEHLERGGNYGVVLGGGVVALDLDNMELVEILGEIAETLTIQSGSGRGRHLYAFGPIIENATILSPDGSNAGNVQARYKQVVGPGSVHWSGGTYDIILDLEPIYLRKEQLDDAFKGTDYILSWSHQKKVTEDEAEKESDLVGDKIPITEVVPMEGLVPSGTYDFQGAHPIHGSDTGQNFTVNTEKNCWHCFRCGTGGGPLSFILVAAGEIRCDEALPGKLRGKLFKRALELARDAGFEVDGIKEPLTEELGFDLEVGVSLDDVLKTVGENFSGLEMAVETMLSVVVLNWFKLNKPFCLVLTGVSGSGKSTVMDMLAPYTAYTLRVDDITAASFVTQKGEKAEEDELAEIDFLPKIEGKVLITPEMSPMFSASEDTLRKTIGVLTRILDGSGYMRAAGTHGLRGYKKDVHFVWIGGTVPFSWRVWRVMSEAGPRMYFLGMPEIRPTPTELVVARKKGDYKDKIMRCRKKLWSFLMELVEGKEIEWDVVEDDEEIMTLIANFAILLTRLRGQVIVKELGGGVYQHWAPRIELAYKPYHALYDVARGHAFIRGRSKINREDLAHAANIALNSAPDDRVKQFKILLEAQVITNGLLADKLNCSISSAQRTTKELLVLGLIERIGDRSTMGRSAGEYQLSAELKWFLSDEFAAIRKDLGINIDPSGVFQATKRGHVPDNWLEEHRSDGQ